MGRVVITGISVISSCGTGKNNNWNFIKNGQSTGFKSSHHLKDIFLEGSVNNEFQENLTNKQKRNLDRVSQFALLCSREAFEDACLPKETIKQANVSIFIGSSIDGMESIAYEIGVSSTLTGITKLLSNMIAANIAIEFNINGSTFTYSMACASGAIAIAEAYEKVKNGQIDIALAGGSEACIVPNVFKSFSNLTALSTANNINYASIPFSKYRSGFVLSEGCALVVLEDF
jgi:3-oxoacyl-[acyl-carrier-protein] synthase II